MFLYVFRVKNNLDEKNLSGMEIWGRILTPQ